MDCAVFAGFDVYHLDMDSGAILSAGIHHLIEHSQIFIILLLHNINVLWKTSRYCFHYWQQHLLFLTSNKDNDTCLYQYK